MLMAQRVARYPRTTISLDHPSLRGELPKPCFNSAEPNTWVLSRSRPKKKAGRGKSLRQKIDSLRSHVGNTYNAVWKSVEGAKAAARDAEAAATVARTAGNCTRGMPSSDHVVGAVRASTDAAREARAAVEHARDIMGTEPYRWEQYEYTKEYYTNLTLNDILGKTRSVNVAELAAVAAANTAKKHSRLAIAGLIKCVPADGSSVIDAERSASDARCAAKSARESLNMASRVARFAARAAEHAADREECVKSAAGRLDDIIAAAAKTKVARPADVVIRDVQAFVSSAADRTAHAVTEAKSVAERLSAVRSAVRSAEKAAMMAAAVVAAGSDGAAPVVKHYADTAKQAAADAAGDAPDQDYGGRQPNRYITPTGLRQKRHWTDSMIRNILGEPDGTQCNPHYVMAAPMRLYLLARVDVAEVALDLEKMRVNSERRSSVARVAADMRRQNELELREKCNLGCMFDKPLAVVRSRAADHNAKMRAHHERQYEEYVERCWWRSEGPRPRRGTAHPKVAAEDRWAVNYLRYQCTRYDDLLDAFGAGARAIMRRRVHNAIAEAYPELAESAEAMM